jgi:AraC-like DNA-binding protein/NADH:ubiquinone oxidoreductase subunit 6 (subunit J)
MLCYGGIILSLFVVLLLNARDVKKGRANIFLSILLLALAFSIAHILFAGAVISHLSAQVYSLGDPTFFLIAPLLWFYTRSLSGERIVFRWETIGHFFPFLLIIFLSLSLRSIHQPDLLQWLAGNHALLILTFWILLVIQFSCYLLAIRGKWQLFKLMVQQEVSNTEYVSISWVRFYMVLFLLVNILFLVSFIVAIHLQDQSWLPRITAVIFALSIFALGYKGILQREIFAMEIVPVASDVKLTIRTNHDDQRLQELKTFMEQNKPFLDADLTLTSLALQMNITRGQLSSLINEGTGSNFYDFINQYRVEQVKKLMLDPSMKNFNMLGIALEAGFKSKSTFNLIFKRFTGLTPTQYRSNLGDQHTS